MKLFGYKRWYEKEIKKEVNGKEKKYPIKVKVKRENKIIKEDEIGREDKIDNKDFIKELVKYKTRGNAIEKKELIGRKFSKNNILFKIKENKEFINVTILRQSGELSEFNKNDKKRIYTRANYEKHLSLEKSLAAKIKYKNEIDIYLFKDEESFKNSLEKYKILYKKNDENETKKRKFLFDKCKKINEKLFTIASNLIKNNCENRYVKEYYIEKINEEELNNIEEIKNLFKEIKEELKNDEKKTLYKEVKFYLNLNKEKISDKKIIFAQKIENYLLFDVQDEEKSLENDIKEFLVEEFLHYELLKRVEKINDERRESWEKTYITNNKHNSYVNKNYSEKLRESEKIKQVELLISTPNIEDLITEIIEKFKLDELKEKIDSKIKETKRNDVELFGIYKEHYKEKEETIKSWIKEEGEENDEENKRKLLAKLTYRYIKGRIEKIVTSNRKDIANILCFDNIVKKVNTRVEQYILENLIYLGKVKILDRKTKLTEENISDKFIEYGIKEELELEFLNFVSATNLYMNELFKTNKDFFGGNGENEKLKLTEYQKGKKIIENRLELREEELEKYREKMVEIRSAIVHRGNSEENNVSIFDYYETSKEISLELEKDYKNVIEKINELKISDEEICKNLNFNILFNNGNMKNIIEKINNINVGEVNTIYFPNYSRLVPRIESELRKATLSKNFNDREFSILKNAFIYLNKVLYDKIISNWKEEENRKEKYKKEYKEAQRKASKGDKKAIKKFQNKFIDKYIEKIKIEYPNLFDFGYLKNIEEQIDSSEEERSFDKDYILKSVSKDIEIKNDFEYIIVVSALIMNDNTYINKFRNRLFSTYSALKSINANNKKSENEKLKLENFQNLIDILDEVVSINKAKRDYMNEKLRISFNNRNKLEEKIESIVNSFDDKDYIDIMVKHKEKLFSNILEAVNKISNSEEALGALLEILHENKKISNYLETKGLKKYTGAFIQMVKIKKDLEKVIKEKEFKDKYIVLKENPKNKKLNNLLEKLKELKEIKEFEEILAEYDKQLTGIKENDKEKKFEEMYYQKNGDLIYKNNIFYYISNKNFELFYEKFLKKDLETVDTEILKNRPEIIKKINSVNKVLTKINSSLKASSKEYKEKFIEGLIKYKSDDNSQKRVSGLENIDKIYNKSKNIFFIDTEFNDYKEFKEAFEEVEKYKKNKAIIEMTIIGKVVNYLIEINWKLAMQISRIERDIDCLYNGVVTLNPVLKIKEKDADKRLERVLDYYETIKNSDIFENLKELIKDLKEKGPKSTRNYIAHFHLLREPFKDKNLKEIIDEVSKLSEYRTRYNNAVYNSCFEVFKKDFDLNYDNLKKKFTLSNNEKGVPVFEITELLSPKQVSILGIETDRTLLEKIKELFEYKV